MSHCDVVQLQTETHTLIAQGAEAKIYVGSFYGKTCVAKVRFTKTYRHPCLDAKLRETRTLREARALLKAARHGIRVPLLLGVDKDRCTLWMEKINGFTVKELLDNEDMKRKSKGRNINQSKRLPICNHNIIEQHNNTTHIVDEQNSNAIHNNEPIVSFEKRGNEQTCNDNNNNRDNVVLTNNKLSMFTIKLLTEIGRVVGELHNHNIIHGDLTTSNFMYLTNSKCASNSALEIRENNNNDDNKEEMEKEKMHDAEVNHLEYADTYNKLVVLDFGLINEKNSVEERAVDLFVLEKAIMATHPFIADTNCSNNSGVSDNIDSNSTNNGSQYIYKNKNVCINKRDVNGVDYIYQGYKATVTDVKRCEATLTRLDVVRARGRKRSMIG